jgi:glutaredoxin
LIAILCERTETARVLLLTAKDCHFCEQGRDTLHKLGREFPLDVEEVALDSERGQKLAAGFGVFFPPGLFLDGSYVGFGRVSERKLKKLLQQRMAGPPAAMTQAR